MSRFQDPLTRYTQRLDHMDKDTRRHISSNSADQHGHRLYFAMSLDDRDDGRHRSVSIAKRMVLAGDRQLGIRGRVADPKKLAGRGNAVAND